MEDIQNKALKNYVENLEYLKKVNRNLYERVMFLSNVIENNEYNERYHLEYIKEDNNFDIHDENTNSYIYNRKPNEYIKKALRENNLDKDNSMDLLHHIIYNNRAPIPIHDSLPLRHKEKALYANDIFEFTKIFKMSTLYKKKQFKYIEKFIFAGTLLGSHIEPIIAKLKPNMIFIYEYNLEIFRLSLFVTNYAQISKKTNIIFSIMEDKEATEASLGNFFHHAVRSNYMLKYYCTNYNIHDFFDRMLSTSAHKNPLSFSYTKIIEGLFKPSFRNIYQYPVLDTKHKHTMLKNKPVLFLAAGPSLGKNIQWIQQNQDNFFIVAIGATIKKLVLSDIKPDLIVSVDADQIIEQQFPPEIREYISGIPFLTSAITAQNVLDTFDKKDIILYEAMGAFKKTSITMNGYSVGEITLNLIVALGGDNIYMLGTDLALDQETGETHTDSQATTKITHTIDESTKELNSFIKNESFDFHNTKLTVKGNFLDRVVTTTIMERSIASYNKSTKIIMKNNNEIKLYNLSNGAYFDLTIPLNISDLVIPTIKKSLTNSDILNYLKNHSSIGFSDEERNNLSKSIELVNKFINEIEIIKKTKLKSYDNFLIKREPALNMIRIDFKEYQIYYLDRIFINYVLTIEPYLGYHFNDKDLKDEANMVKKVKNIWCKQLLHLAEQYKQIVEKAI